MPCLSCESHATIEPIGFHDKQIKKNMNSENKLNKEQQETMQRAYEIFKNAINNFHSVSAKMWLEKHALSEAETGAGYISERVHQNKPKQFKEQFEKVELLKPYPNKIGHLLFGRNSIVFPLKDQHNNIVNFYAIEIEKQTKAFLNQNGLYPNYPLVTTEKLFITKTILDAATILQCKLLKEKENVLALFDGEWTAQHTEAIKSLSQLKEVIVIE